MKSVFRSRSGLMLLGALCLARPTFGQAAAPSDMNTAYNRMIVYERDYSEVMNNLEYLSDMIGPRLTGSDRLLQANKWTSEKMKLYGLENVHLESYTIPRGWERGAVSARIVSPNGLSVSAAQMAWTPGTRGTVTGNVVIFAPETEKDFEAFRGKLKNAIVLASRASNRPVGGGMMGGPTATPLPPIPALKDNKPAPPKEAAPDYRNFDYKKYVEFRKKVAEFMQKEGVAAVLQDSSKPHDLLNMTGSWLSNSRMTTLFVTHEHVAMIQRLLGHNVPVKMELRVTCRFVPGPVTVYNTVGEIKGSEKPNEIVLLGAHLDSWDLGTGTTDNGTGSMAVLEAARLLKSLDMAPKRTIRFVLFTGEEQGLCGSEAYVKAHKDEMPNYDVVFVHDTGTGRVKGLWLQDRAECKPMLAQKFGLLDSLGLLTDKPNLLDGKMNGTDHASFDDAGVPAFAFNQDSAEYGLTHHSQSDTFDKARPDDLKQGACVLAILALDAAQSPERYPRKPDATASTTH